MVEAITMGLAHDSEYRLERPGLDPCALRQRPPGRRTAGSSGWNRSGASRRGLRPTSSSSLRGAPGVLSAPSVPPPGSPGSPTVAPPG